MNLVACYKLVPEEQDIVVKSDQSLDMSRAGTKISLYDLNAVEAAVQLQEQIGSGTVTALSVGGRALEQSKARKDILSRGPDRLVVMIDENLDGALSQQTARALASALRETPHDLVLCGEGSGDVYAQQVGLWLGEELGVPALNGITGITPEEGHVVVTRTLEHEVEVLRVPLPAVLTLAADCNLPRIPGMKAILAAGKKPVVELAPVACGEAASTISALRAPAQADRATVLLEGDSDENIAAFAKALRKAI